MVSAFWVSVGCKMSGLECCALPLLSRSPGPSPVARSSSSTSSSTSVASPSSSGGTASRPQHTRLQARQGSESAECVSFPGQRRLRSFRSLVKVGTTKIRRGLLVLSVCARISHRKLLGGMSRSRRIWLQPDEYKTWPSMSSGNGAAGVYSPAERVATRI